MSTTIRQGNDFEISGTVTDESGSAVDLSAADLDYQISARGTDESALVSLNETDDSSQISGDASGNYTITLTPTETGQVPGTYIHEFLIVVTSETYTVFNEPLHITDSLFTSD